MKLSMVRGRLGWVVWLVVSLALVLDVGDIAGVSVGHVVSDDLGAAVGKGNAVLAMSGVTVAGLILGEVSARVVIGHSVLVAVDSWAIIGWLLVAVDRSRVIGGGLVDHWGWVVDRFVDNGGSVVDWGVVDNWLVVHNGSGVVDGGRVVVDRGGVAVDGLVDGDVGRSMNSSAVLLSGVGVVHVLGSCVGLLGHNGGIGSVGFVNGVAYSWSISVLDDLMVGLVSSGSGQEGRDSNKSLQFDERNFFFIIDWNSKS